MPMHNWTRVEAGIYHAFHHEWVSEIKRVLNRGLLPSDYYALAEQVASRFGPDVPRGRDHRDRLTGQTRTASTRYAPS
jgi:hypothetical protein